jgi:hypothetical protein
MEKATASAAATTGATATTTSSQLKHSSREFASSELNFETIGIGILLSTVYWNRIQLHVVLE